MKPKNRASPTWNFHNIVDPLSRILGKKTMESPTRFSPVFNYDLNLSG